MASSAKDPSEHRAFFGPEPPLAVRSVALAELAEVPVRHGRRAVVGGPPRSILVGVAGEQGDCLPPRPPAFRR